MATTSAVALLAGAASPAFAQTYTITGPTTGNNVTIPSGYTAVTVGVTVLGGTVSIGGSVINTGTINHTGTVAAVNLNQGTFIGGITNSGLVSVGESAAVAVSGSASVAGGISNAAGATISAGGSGVVVGGLLSFAGGITNSGTISSAGARGISSAYDSTFSGGITNSGTIGATAGIVLEAATTFAGGIANTGTITAAGYGMVISDVSTFTGGIANTSTISAGAAGIRLGTTFLASFSTFSGGITNSGTISAGGSGIRVNYTTTFTGGITNSGSGTILANIDGLTVSTVSIFSGGITNSGAISAVDTGLAIAGISTFGGGITNIGSIGAGKIGIAVGLPIGTAPGAGGSTFAGGIANSGSITSGKTGVLIVGLLSFGGGITNSGALSGGVYGIQVGNLGPTTSVTTFSGGITNSGTLSATRTGLGVFQVSTFGGGIVNSGTLSAAQTGVSVSLFSTFSGGISNSGTLSAASAGVAVSSGSIFSGGITNGGMLSGGVFVGLVSTFSGGIVNSAGATLVAGTNGGEFAIQLYMDSAFSGGITNAGQITYTGSNTHAGILVGGVTSFDGGIINSGSITAGKTGILLTTITTFSGGIANSGTISAGGVGIHVGTSYGAGISAFAGGVTNSGTISSAYTGILLQNTSTFSGGITNSGSGTISAGSVGIRIGTTSDFGVASFGGGITNSGLITRARTGILVTNVATFTGGIANGGTISAAGAGIVVGTTYSIPITTFSGNIINSGAITANYGIYVSGVSTFLNSVVNSGIISTGGPGIDIDNDQTVVGGVTNSGAISSSGGTGILIVFNSAFSGGITSSGAISAGMTGVLVSTDISVGGGITNSGTISAGQAGIKVGTFTDGGGGAVSAFSGGVINSGMISAGGTGISVNNVLAFSGGVTNSGTISSNFTGIFASNVSTFSGGIANSGMISAGGGGIRIGTSGGAGVSAFSGGIANSGTIASGFTGIFVANVSTFSGGITNSGAITAGGDGIRLLYGSTFTGGITNAGAISAPFDGILVEGATSVGGGITNSGTISTGSAGIFILGVSTFTGGVTNSGAISAVVAGIQIGSNTMPNLGVSAFSGGVTNTGMISAGGTGILIENTPSVSIFDSGTIIGGNGTAIKFDSGINTLTLGPGFVINGNVLGAGSDIFQLGGTGTGAFNLSSLGTQYTGFSTFDVTSATWVATGTGNQNWSISNGATLQLGNGGASGSITGNIVDNGTFAIDRSDTYTFGGTISGSGAFAQIGPGTTVLTANNSYSGGTTITAGALQLGNGGANGSITGNIADNGTFAIDRSDTYTFGGAISGSGAFAQMGPGTTVLTAHNSYSGGTTITAGTLQATNNSSVGTGTVTLNGGTFQSGAAGLAFANPFAINTGGGTIDTQANTLSLSGSIANGNGTTGSLTKIGSGTLTLSGSNTYSGGTSLNAGMLAVGSSTALGTGGLAMADGTVLQAATSGLNLGNVVTLGGAGTVDSQSYSVTLSGTISGASLTKIGSGTLTLSGANTYSGGTSLNAGTLAVGNSAALGTGGLTMSGGTTLQSAAADLNLGNAITLGGAGTIDSQSNSFTLSGNISGAGSLTKIGSGFLTLSGANTYSGGTSILAGALIGNTTSLQGNIFDNAVLVFNQAVGGVYTGSLSGSGALTVAGPGGLTLTGNSGGFTGDTRLANSALAVGTLTSPSASLGGTIEVLQGGVLSGHGTVGTVNNLGGTVIPGGSIGTLTVSGNYTQNSTGTLMVEVSPTASSQLKVGGAAALGGTLMLDYNPGTYTARSYTFVSAPSVSGTFNDVVAIGSSPGLSQGLTFNPATGQLVLGGAFTVSPTNDTIFPAMTTTLVQNAQQANSIVLDRLSSRLGGNGDSAPLASIATAPSMQLAQLGAGSNLAAIESVASALPEAIAERGGWFRGIGSFGSLNGNSTAPGFSTESGGFLIGFDQAVMPNVFAGLAAGYTHTNVEEHSTSSGDVNTARVMAYGGGLVGSALWSVTAGYAHDSIDTQRGLAGIGAERASYGANELTLGGQWSLPLQIGDATVTPQAGARFLRLFQGSFIESGAEGFNLAGASNAITSIQPFIGATASHSFVTDNGTQIIPVLQVGYAREVAHDGRTLDVSAIDGTTFLAQGVQPSRDIVTAGAGFTVRARDNLYVYADYDAILPTGNAFKQTFSVGVRILFPPVSQASSATEPQGAAYNFAPDTAGPDNAELLAKQQELFSRTFRDPSNLDVIYAYADVSARVGDNEAAAEALERMLLFNPNLPSVDVELGVLYYRMGSFEAAQAYLDKARTLDPSPEVQARIDEYTAKIADAQQANAFSGSFSLGTQYQTDANVAPGSPLINSPIGEVLLSDQYVKHDDTNFFATGSFLYSYDLGTQDGDALEVTGAGFANHYLEFNRLDLDFGEVTAGPRLRYPSLAFGPLQAATFKPYAIVNEVGLGEKQYFFTYGAGLEGTAVLWGDLSARVTYELRQKNFTNAPDRPLSTGLDGNDNLVTLALIKPVTANSQLLGELDYLDQSTRLAYYSNSTYSVSAGYHIRYNDPTKLLNLPWETVVFGSRSWSIYAAPDPCCNTGGSTASFSPSARDDRHWRFGVTQSFQVTANAAIQAQLQRDIVSSNLSIYGYTSDSLLVDLKIRF